MKIQSLIWNSDLVGYVITLNDNRIVQVQFELNENALHGDYNTYSACIDKQNDYSLDLTDEEEEFIIDYIKNNKEIRNKEIELNLTIDKD